MDSIWQTNPTPLRRNSMKTKLGYMALLEKMKPNESLKYVIEAEKVGMDMIWVNRPVYFSFPPMTECGFAWCFMASALQATEKIPFATGVTAPIMRYNPAIVAQAFATMNCMYPWESKPRSWYREKI